MSEISPTIVVDRTIGAEYDSIDVDVETITSYLANHGMTDQEILDLTIAFHYDETKQVLKDGEIGGEYDPSCKTVSVNVGQILKTLNSIGPMTDGKSEETIIKEAEDEAVTKILTHELEHAIDFKNAENTNVSRWYQGSFIFAGSAAITGSMMGINQVVSELHNYEHAGALAIGVLGGCAIAKSMPTLVRQAYLTDPAERRARKAEATHSSELEGAITLGQKNKHTIVKQWPAPVYMIDTDGHLVEDIEDQWYEPITQRSKKMF